MVEEVDVEEEDVDAVKAEAVVVAKDEVEEDEAKRKEKKNDDKGSKKLKPKRQPMKMLIFGSVKLKPRNKRKAATRPNWPRMTPAKLAKRNCLESKWSRGSILKNTMKSKWKSRFPTKRRLENPCKISPN